MGNVLLGEEGGCIVAQHNDETQGLGLYQWLYLFTSEGKGSTVALRAMPK